MFLYKISKSVYTEALKLMSVIYYTNFLKQLEIGKEQEQEAINRITRNYHVQLVEQLNNSDYDFKTSDGKTYEVKFDQKSTITNNFFIEYHGFAKKTGIDITRAKYYIITDGTNYYKLRTRHIKTLIKNNKYFSYTMNDISKTKGWLIPKKDIIELSTIL